MRTKEQYIKGLSKMKRNVYYDGALIDRTDELQARCLDVMGTTFEEAAKPESQVRGLTASPTSIRTRKTFTPSRT
jgi:aromatic ring hydroxylase